MKLLMGAAAATAALAIAAVPASFALTSGGVSTTPTTTDVVSSPPTTDATSESPSDEATESPYDISLDIPTDAPTRGWEVEHPNNGKHGGWYKNNGHAYGEAMKQWAKCVSTTGKANCDPKPDKATISPDPTPTDATSPLVVSAPTSSDTATSTDTTGTSGN